jgi:nondiscriminating aspartyl-tRNA synthetase
MKNRVLVKDLAKHTGKSAMVAGWLYKRRLLGGLNFLVVRDRTGLVQILVEDEKELKKLEGLQLGTVLSVTGEAFADERAPGGVEIHEPTLEVLSPVKDVMPIEVDKPISHKSEHLDTLFEHRVINIRNVQEQKIFKIRASVNRYIREYLTERDFVEIQTPKLQAEATEGGAEVFKLDYYGREATLAQSPQLYKQILVGAYERVFEIGPAFRAEPSTTTRHLSEVTMLDIEMAFVDHNEVLDLVGDMTTSVIRRVYQDHADDLKSLNAPELKLADAVPKLSVTDIHELYTDANKTNTTTEKDLIPDEEKWINEYAKKEFGTELVYATDFPIEAMKFYHQINPKNPKTVLWADLLYRGLEIATVPLREHRYEVLLEQMKKAGLDVTHPGYQYYLQAFKYGLPQHGGCGFGIDRFVEKIIGLGNIKEATLFPRDMQRLTP